MRNAVRKSPRSSYALMLLCSYALFCLCRPAGVRAADLPKTANLVPPETALLVSVEDFGQLKTMFEKTSLFRLYTDPAMKPFVDDLKSKWEDKARESDNELVGIVKEAATLPQGRAVVAVVLDAKTQDAKEPPVVL
ncbi:MAG: hypothetical protein ACYS14_13140, partial [Planctomycetota bacterium]